VFLVNSRLGLFTASVLRRNPFSRGYGVILPSSLARVLSSALVSSTHLPVSVCGTVTRIVPYEAFLVSVGSPEFVLTDFPIAPLPMVYGFAYIPAQCLDLNHHQAQTTLLRHPFGQTLHRRYWIINQFSIGYAFRPHLRSD
jgi:hypothetical protein